ncbi:Jlp2p SCDLUD_002432 [Saccharomycodes ludwigii]|uniref:Jlp2p n=1 Tax=Saccharomycodes ludwigii TaxID=36035 RepID=UPI001E884109|nr:hypothetical protein SCDLUD_002432 [Saccharomycodes ludwigii]KAH3900969.1 hypothetical protein SCDLUD_002432 [Saccharomycodes ludwigii]
MVYFYQSLHEENTTHPYWLITGKDKFENDLLIKYGYRESNMIWFHADKYSSGHIYLKLHDKDKGIDDIPKDVLLDVLQLCKSSSIHGNKLPECRIIYTPWYNLKKSGTMNPGEVSFKSTRFVQRIMCYQRNQKILNRLQKTRVEVDDLHSIVQESNYFKSVQCLLSAAKASKDPDFLIDYVKKNKDFLIEQEKLKKVRKKQKKREEQESL